ncbi:hypothetical protein BSZ21_06095 [Bradyrhizobium canariense]|nr:hypothetical protein BSZ21_06095 [Bradyrhizobium canariense]
MVGHVVKMTGSASIVRNGVTIIANTGDVIYQNDVVQTGSNSTIGLVLDDGSTFNLSANARFLLGDLTYDPGSSSNSAFLTLVQGAASFVAGQVAKTGDMRVATPVASIGIRGTAVNLEISSADGTVSISVIDQRDNSLHAVEVFNNAGVLIGTVTSNGASLTLTPTATFEVIAQQVDKTADQVAREFNAFQQVLSTYDAAKQILPNLPEHTDNGDHQNDNNASPNSTKFAGSPPLNPPGTEYHSPAATNTTQTTNGETSTTTIQVTINTVTPTEKSATPESAAPEIEIAPSVSPVKLTSLPFVVTPPYVNVIASGPGDHSGPVMSANGDVVYDPDGAIYFYDRAANSTTTIASPAGGWIYGSPTISSDGRYIIYEGSNGSSYVFAYGTDPSDSTHFHVQTQIALGQAPAVSGDGSTILARQADGDIAIYGLQGNLKGIIAPATVGSSGALWAPAISADGHLIVFWNSDSNAVGGSGHLFSFDLSTGEFSHLADTSVGAGTTLPTLSADGHLIAYQSADATGHSEIYLYDLESKAVLFHTANASSSFNPVLSPDGHFIVFTSDAKLSAADTNAVADVYIVDVTSPAAPVYKLVSEGAGVASNGGVAISAGGQYVAFAGDSGIFFADPTLRHSAVITETINSPSVLQASGVIPITGNYADVKISTADQFGNADPNFSAKFDDVGNISWAFSEEKSDFDALSYGRDATQKFVITLSADDGVVTIPVYVTVHNGVQPNINVVDFKPIANPVTLQDGQQDASYTITSAALLIGVVDVDGPSLSISALSIRDGGGSLDQVDGQTWRYTPDQGFSGRVIFNYEVTDSIKSAASIASLDVALPLALVSIAPDTELNGDFVTSSQNLTVSGTNGVLFPGERIQISSDGGANWSDVAQTTTSTWSFIDPLSHGTSFTYHVRVVDSADVAINSTSQVVTIDTTAPSEALAITAITQDTGTAGDCVTSDTTLTVSGSNGALGSGEKIQVSSDGGSTWTDVTQSTATSWNYVDPATHAGSFTYQTRIIDTAGNIGTTASQAVTIDTSAPTITISNAGGPTNQANQTIAGTVDVADAGAIVTVYDGITPVKTAIVQGDGSWSALVTLSNGSNSLTAKVTDLAGNTTTSNAVVYTLSTTGPAVTEHLTSDTGSSALDQVTSNPALSGTGLANTTVHFTIDGTLIATTSLADGSGNWSFTPSGLADGLHTIVASQTDTFGNTGSASLILTLDTTAPSEALAITAITQDTGTAGDFITSDTTLTVSGSNGALGSGEKIQVSSDGGSTWTDVTQSTATSWSYVDPATHAGSFSYQTRIIDPAGNIGTTASQAVTIDTTAPTITISNVGGQTNQANQTVVGTVDVADAGAIVTVYDGITPVKTAIVQGDGSWSALVTLSNGSNSLTAKVTDLAGNTTTSNAVVYTLSTTGPAVTEHLTSDTGSSALDQVTSNPALSGTGLANTTVHFTIDGTLIATTSLADGSGNWSFTPSGLADGLHTIVASQTDTFGNTGSASLILTLDTTAPSEALAITAITQDTGTAGDFITSDTTLTVSGSNGALGSGEKIQVSSDGGSTWTDVTQSTATSWSYVDPATHVGSFSYQTRIIDTAGNIGTTASQAVTIDTTTPSAPMISTVTDDVSPLTGSVAENGFSNDPTLTVAGTTEAGSTVTLYDTDGTTVLGTGIAVGGSYSITTAGLSQGSHTLTAKATDVAGNTTLPSSAFHVVVDTLAPADIILSNTSVAENSVTGTVVGSLLEVDPGGTGTATFSLLDNAGGRFAISNGNLVVAGSLDYETAQSHQVTVRVADAAGNIFDKDLTVAVLDVAGVTVTGDASANVLIGTIEADSIFGLGGNDRLQGLGGNDSLDGGAGFDRAVYSDATGSVTVNLAAGTASGAGVGSDTLISIEGAVGGDFADTFDATGFTGSSAQPGVALGQSAFEGRGGDDVITGRINDLGQSLTRVEYLSASAAVTVDLAARTGQGTAAGDVANVGHDTFTNALQGVYGSAYGDTIYGSNNANFTYEVFEGRGGNDYIDGRGGYDMVAYNNDVTTTSSITINLAAGTVVGDSSIGTDTLRDVEAVRGTNFDDTFDATGYGLAGALNVSSTNGNFNDFAGAGGNDTLIGNGNTRLNYSIAQAAITVDLQITAGTAITVAGSATGATEGTDTFTGVNAVQASVFADTLLGSSYNNTFTGLGGDDYIDGRDGFDTSSYNNLNTVTGGIAVHMAAGTVIGDASSGTDTLRNIEGVQGTGYVDTYDATGYGLAGALNVSTSNGSFNQFEGLGGDDSITGNGNTRVLYSNATGAVTITISAGGTGSALGDASTGHDTFTGGVNSAIGSNFADGYNASAFKNGFNSFQGNGGNDTITGNGSTQVQYSNATSGVTITIGAGGAGSASGDGSVGTDSFTGVNSAAGGNLNDTYNASGYGAGLYNSFQGNGGNDTITGNGSTQVQYFSATSGVTITIGAGGTGSASGDGSVGSDTFVSGVNSAVGGNLNDTYNASGFGAGLYNSFHGNGGNDTITGNGSTQVQYGSATSGVTITIGAGGTGSASGDSSVGTDSFTGVYGAIGGNFDDTYNASAFSAGQFNSFQGNGGNDTITGNGSTQIEYFSATAGVNVNLTSGVASGNASVGTDTITGGVSGVQGSNFADTITGSSGNDSLFGNGGDDILSGVGGNDYLAGGLGADTFVYSIGGADYIGDFNRSEGDRIDLTGVTGVFTLADIQARATQQGSDTLINFGGGNTITLANVTVGSLVASDFLFNNSIIGTSANDVLVGTSQSDGIFGLGGNDRLQGLGGNDSLDGGAGFDRAVYSDATGSVTVNLAAGTASGAGVGSDTLISIEGAVGGDFADTFDATGFTGSSAQPGVALGQSAFEGRGGDDVITGRINDLGQSLTRVEYLSASAAVTVDLAARTGQGTAAGDVANVGHDTFTNALQGVYGSAYGDTIYGSNNANFTYEVFEGRGGNDYIDGRGGYDMVAYNNDVTTTSSITINLAAGTVVGDSSIGTDTLRDVEAVRGTNFDDTFDATGYGLAGALNVSSTNGNFNDFAGAGGNDTLIGNGNTRLNYSIAQAAITVDLQITAGTAITVAGSATGATEGTDTFTGVNAVQASVFADTLLGSSYNNTFTGLGGDDYIDGRDGFDTSSYNNLNTVTGGIAVHMAAGTVIGDASSGTDTLRNIEGVQGTGYVDTYDATGYGLAGALNVSTSNGSFNQFEGLGGDDSITGNGNTRVLYSNATGAVTITIGAGGAGSALGDASTGHDTFTGGVNSAIGSNFVDSYNASAFNNGFNSFQGNGGNDTIAGNGSTQVQYSNATSGVTVDLIAGTAVGNSSVGTDTITGGVNSVLGSNFNDVISGTNNATVTDVYFGGGGNDTIDGRGGYDLANYNDSSVSAAINVNLAAGTVVGDGSVGSDILHGVELIRGSRFADTYDATGFNGSSTNAGSYDTFNTFEGMAGNDTVTGNGDTRVDYSHALAAVTVDLAAGTGQGAAAGDIAGVGFDTFTGGVNSIRGSDFDDALLGSNNATGAEDFIGGAGNDTIDGRGGFDRAMYSASSSDTTTGAIVVDLAAGTVTGDASIGNDTLKSIESIRGTNFADTFNASGFSGSSVNAGSNGTLNEFEGEAGNDTITGNGNTRIAFYHAASGVNVDLSTGFSTSLTNGDVAHVGTDTFTGVAAVRGSDFGDQITGKSGSVTLDGRGGDDILIANGGANILVGGVGNDQFKFKAALANGATISDFAGNGAAVGDSIDFEGFGTAAQGATFTFVSAAGADSIWQIHSGLDGHNELITLKGIATSAGVHSSDYLFAP